ncbi:MAG: hypothetical protein RLZZ618_2236 [Pseudomonadota bacterium]|jgi:copper chaperone
MEFMFRRPFDTPTDSFLKNSLDIATVGSFTVQLSFDHPDGALKMKTFHVNDMTCGHCVSAVTNAIKAIDPAAHVSVDLATKLVEVDSAVVDVRAITNAITTAGYTAVEETGVAKPVQAARGSSCCGSCR